MEPLALNEIIVDYKLVDFIREYHGVFVYKVKNMENGKYYTLKTMSATSADQEHLSMFINEIRILSSIDHPLFVGFVESFIFFKEELIW